MPLADQYAFVGLRPVPGTTTAVTIWSGPPVSGFLVNVGQSLISINLTPTLVFDLNATETLGVKNVTSIKCISVPGASQLAVTLFYSEGAASVSGDAEAQP